MYECKHQSACVPISRYVLYIVRMCVYISKYEYEN